MDIFEERYFNFNKKIFVFIGLWPFGLEAKNIRKYLVLFLLFLSAMPSVISVKVNFSDIDRVMLNAVFSFAIILMFFKVLSIILAEKEMKGLYRNIAENWLAITDDKEKEILVEYSERGRKKAIYYFAFIEIGGCSVFALPTLPKLLDMISPLPYSRQNIHILEGELLCDRETHYWLYYFSDVATVILTCTVTATIDTMFIICVEHCCALYAIIRYRLRNLRSKIIDSTTSSGVDSYDYVIDIIRLHQVTLNFTATVNEAFSMLFLFILIANMGAIPLVAVTVISNLDEPYNFLRFVVLFMIFGVHLFMLFWPGQIVLDHGTDCVDDAYCNEWYTAPLCTRKMIIIFMIRSSKPASLDAGGLMLMNFETFSMIVRTAISYITVVASFR